jgi:hypothetical protein
VSGRFSATVCVPLQETGRVELAVDIPDLGALSGEARSLVFSLLGRCVEFAADMYAPKLRATAGSPRFIDCTFAPDTTSTGSATDTECHEPIACPVEPCTFEAKGETGLRIHLSTTHKLRGESKTAVAERNRLVDAAMGRTPSDPEPIQEPPPIDIPVTRKAVTINISDVEPVEPSPPANGTTRIVTLPSPPPIVAPPPPVEPVEWPSEPLAKVPFDPDVARRRAAEAL